MSFRGPPLSAGVVNPTQLIGSGPGQSASTPLDVVQYGGLQKVTQVITDTGIHTILSPPTIGTVRLHSFRVQSATPCYLSGATTQAQYAIAEGGNVPSDLVPGQLVIETLTVQNPTSGGNYRVTLTYDVVATPVIV